MKSFLIFLLLIYQVVDGSQRPMDAMSDLTNDLGVCILQILATMQEGNVVFSPYGIASVSILLFEGATGNTALEILRVLNLPWNTLLARIGFRDMNRHLKTYFKSDGFLRGLVMSRDEVCFHSDYQKILRLYGFEEPDNALTYPCHGFIPYSPTTTALPVLSTDAVTIASTPASEATTPTTAEGSTAASTEISTVTDENIVTELTQTSQTVMLFNATTFRTVNASEDGALQTSNSNPTTELNDSVLKTEAIFPQESFTASETVTSLNSFVNPANLSSQPTTNEKLNEPLTTEIIETLPKSESVTLSLQVKTIEPSGSETVLIPNFSSPYDFPVDFTSSETSPESTKIKSDRVNATRSLFKQHKAPTISKMSQEILRNQTKNILNKYKNRNFTNINDIIAEIEKDLKSNSSESNSTFPDELLDDLLASSKTSKNSSEESISSTISKEFDDLNDFFNNFTTILDSISSTEIFKNLKNSTKFKLFNDTLKKFKDLYNNDSFEISTEKFNNNSSFEISTEKFDNNGSFEISTEKFDIALELIPINNSAPFFNTSTEINLNETSTFYDTLFGLIENTTQSIKDFIGFSTTTVSPTLDSIPLLTTPNQLNSTTNPTKNVQNLTTTNNPLENQVTLIPTLASGNNLNKSELGTEMKDHVLPKKSISGQNENAGVEYTTQKPPNYVNVVSLKQSKLTSTTFNIKGVRPPKHISKRSIKVSSNTTKNVTNANYINCSSVQKDGKNNSLCSNILKSSNGTESGKRIIRSFDHHEFKSYHGIDFSRADLDWFTLFDNRNMIQVPTFTYSAFLPYAYIDDLKSKVLEVPLDDSHYSLLVLLPTHRYGLNYLLSSLTNWSIRKIYRQLRPISVYAIIPKFRVVSHVDLKPALYSLGIKDIFHRYRADLSIMSPDARLYVRSIEQVVTVHVDKYPNAVYEVPEKLTERSFSASHPFLYFVIDKESQVSLVAGIMADPSKQQVHFL